MKKNLGKGNVKGAFPLIPLAPSYKFFRLGLPGVKKQNKMNKKFET